ncbi:MAG TPA: hypothetical protein VLB69_00850 [Rudaea sp.]|nr:hypothetical protein [Rudaea sp.]
MKKLLAVGVCATCAMMQFASADPLTIERVNVNPDTSAQADGSSDSPSLSADGGVVAFVSSSTTLADPSYGLTANSPPQIYAFDRNKKSLELISVTADGTEASDGPCSLPQVSADGLFVAFLCSASNLPKSGTNASNNTIYIHDRSGGTTFMPMNDWLPAQPPLTGASNPGFLHRYMSGDAARITFEYTGGVTLPSVNYLDQSAGTSSLNDACSPAVCLGPQISTGGSHIALVSSAAISIDDTNGFADVYLYDVDAKAFTLVSVNGDKSQGNGDVSGADVAVSGDGAFVAFSSFQADNLGDPKTANLLLVRDVNAGTLAVASVNDGSATALPVLSPRPALSDEGIVLAFTSDNAALAPHPNKPPADALVRHMKAELLRSVCRSRSGTYGNNTCLGATVSADGNWAAFTAAADNLVPDDTNSQPDIFVVSLDVLFDDIFADGHES